MGDPKQTGLRTRVWRALAGPARLRDSVLMTVAALVCAGAIFGVVYDLFDRALRQWSERDLARHASLIAAAAAGQVREGVPAGLDLLAATDETMVLRACSPAGVPLAVAGKGAIHIGCASTLARRAIEAAGRPVRGKVADRSVVVTAHALADASHLLVVLDRTFVESRRHHLLRTLFIAAELALLAFLLLARAGARIGSRRTGEEARSIMRRIRSRVVTEEVVPAELRLFVRDVNAAVEHFRGAGSREGAERLRAAVADSVPSGGLVVVANREPYAHQRAADGSVVVERPASGLVTGLEPILRACGGTWLAHASGSEDRAHSDRYGRVPVPPEEPEYTLRRLFIERDAYDHYYSGLANEGLWPLCHMAYAQPSFRVADWAAYQAVNETFARAAAEEVGESGLLLVQDYHFALLPRMVRNQAPHVVTSLFWHIPWPNAETAGICPWKETLLEGMIGADVVGFHTTQYCLNFLDTVQRYLECRVDRDDMSITFGGHRTLVRAYPISIEWPYPAASRVDGAALRRALGISADAHVCLGVDRADYTKGLLERVAAVELFLEQNPALAGRFVFVQIASPTRSTIRRYQQLTADLIEAVDGVNARFGTAGWKPIVLQMRTSPPEEVRRYYAMADSALVTPLHDGMNLVAKEYVASCADGDGALVLSRFAGAAKELEGALIVNPYDLQQVADAIQRAVQMPVAERRARMQAMRAQIAGSSIYDWSERMLADMCDVRRQRSRFWPHRPAKNVRGVAEVAAG